MILIWPIKERNEGKSRRHKKSLNSQHQSENNEGTHVSGREDVDDDDDDDNITLAVLGRKK